MQTIHETPDTYGNITQATFLQFVDEYLDVDAAVDQAVGMRKDLRKRIKGAGISLAAFDRARKEADKSEETREEDDREFRRLMAWLGKPIGTQGDLFAEPPEAYDEPEGDEEINPDQAYQVELAGQQAGESGRDRASNPWGVGSALNARWDRGWCNGQGQIAERMRPPEGNGAHQIRRGPGRPPGSRNRPKHETGDDAA